ncbi:MAG: CDP-alcohol phosphatidyltransferase family protein [Enterococcus sp.]
MHYFDNWKQDIYSIPNILSICRILLIPFFFFFFFEGNSLVAGILILISGITDFADGYIARQYNQITNLGKVLDPVADKLTQCSLIFVTTFTFPIAWAILGLFLLKELFMFIVGSISLKKEQPIDGAKWYGKVATAVIYVCMILFLLFPDFSMTYHDLLLWLVLLSLVLSFVLYARYYWAHFFK